MRATFLQNLYLLLTCCLAATGCRPPPPPHSAVAALAHNRYLIGEPPPWQPAYLDPDLLAGSVTARRRAAWATVAQALQPVPLYNPATKTVLRDRASGDALTLPLWQTWYELDEFKAMFATLYWDLLSPAQREHGQAEEAQIDEVMAAFPRSPLGSRWLERSGRGQASRFERLLEQFTDAELVRSVNGVSGQGYTLFSPALLRHYLRHFRQVSRCRGTPPDVVTHTTADFATCFGEAFPAGAVAIKATWANSLDGVADFATDASGLARMLTAPQPSWTPANRGHLARPTSAEIYTADSFVDERQVASFRLLGLHIITKEIPNWQWTTLWWSGTPDTDFGEDRPAAISAESAVWANYKMCTVAAFSEQDPGLIATDPRVTVSGLLAEKTKSLSAALQAAYHFGRPGTLCSNPFIEFQKGMAGTNCIGCHQHAGPFASRPVRSPGRAQARQNFMTDFLWSFEDTTEQFRGAIVEVLTNPP